MSILVHQYFSVPSEKTEYWWLGIRDKVLILEAPHTLRASSLMRLVRAVHVAFTKKLRELESKPLESTLGYLCRNYSNVVCYDFSY